MKYKSPVFASGSGSIGGMVFSRNRYGPYVRNRAIPVNPNSPLQVAVRADFATLAAAWSGLTDTQRAQWDDYAANVPLIDALGDPVNVTGYNMYQRSNVPRLQVGLPRVDDGPGTFSLPEITGISAAGAVSTGNILYNVTFDDAQAWVDEDDAGLLLFTSIQKAPTINFFKGPFNALGPILGDAVTAPTTPALVATTTPGTIGNIAFLAYRLSRADGRLSSQSILTVDIAA